MSDSEEILDETFEEWKKQGNASHNPPQAFMTSVKDKIASNGIYIAGCVAILGIAFVGSAYSHYRLRSQE